VTVWILLLTFAHADLNQGARYGKEQRVDLLRQTLSAFAETPYSETKNSLLFLRNQSRYACASGSPTLKIQCLIEAARTNCMQRKKTAPCLMISDVLASNIVEESSFLSRRELQKILRNSHSSGDATLAALSGRYARLTTDYMTATGDLCAGSDWACLAASVDNFCVQKSNDKKQSWQGCAGAIIWMIGHEGHRE
jgi:hypothetical protein